MEMHVFLPGTIRDVLPGQRERGSTYEYNIKRDWCGERRQMIRLDFKVMVLDC